jgi:acyl-CoA synthetase (AMP-forming)/AMP-acid ligase II
MQHPRQYAQTAPDRPAAIDAASGAVRTYAELDARANRFSHALRGAGLQTGDHIAIVLDNRLEMFDVLWGAMDAGLYVTPVNWHLAHDEVKYIVDDCGASALVVAADVTDAVADLGGEARSLQLAVGRELPGFDDFESALAGQPSDPVADEAEGSWMFYSSGTTGRPKGIKPPTIGAPIGSPNGFSALVGGLFGIGEGSTYLCPAPLYHSAPAGWSTTSQRLGATVVFMHSFDAEACLATIEQYRVTHVQFVPTHLVRILKLDPEVRAKYDLSSLQVIVHAAAPCPPDVKRGAIELFGPILHEYYAGSEGGGFCYIDSDDWLAHPGSVGKPLMGAAHVTDEDGNELPNGEAGQIWFESENRFEYHGDKQKTAEAWDDRGWMTLGDVGYVDDEGYVFLTDRVSNMIISGGVNIYPRETEDVLIGHPAVHDVAVIGVPHPEMGESVRAVVQLAEPVADEDAMAEELRAYCRERLSHFKCPTSVVFVDELPRLPSGKIAKRMFSDEVRGLTPA